MYTYEKETGDLVISGWEKGIAPAAGKGIANIQAANISTEEGEVMCSFSRILQSQTKRIGIQPDQEKRCSGYPRFIRKRLGRSLAGRGSGKSLKISGIKLSASDPGLQVERSKQSRCSDRDTEFRGRPEKL